jgi:RNA polymerase sigma-70 factor, ECF subfamily
MEARMWKKSDRSDGDAELHILIDRSRRGDVTAFNGLVERYQEGAFALAFRMLGERESAADATQDAFLAAFRAVGNFRGTSFKAWLFRIVSNACYDRWRAQKRRPTVSLDSIMDHDPDADVSGAGLAHVAVDDPWDPERVALRAEVVDVLQSALLQVPVEQRLALVLSDVQGMTYEEIAEVMQTSLGTVKSRISRARGHMRDALRAHEELLPSAFRQANESD